MPVHVTIDPVSKLVTVECSGAITDADWWETFPKLWADPAFDRTFDKLIDTRRVTTFAVKGETVFRLGASARQLYEGVAKSKTAVVAPLPAVHGTARQHQLFTEGIAPETKVFWTYEEACTWLGRKSGASPPSAEK